MRTSGQTSRVTLGDVVTVLAGVVTFGGYVLLVGAVVAWLDVRTIGVPAISVVADMPRNELLGLGFETLAVWLLLGLMLALAIVGIGSTVREDPRRPLGVLVVSTMIGVLFAGIWQLDSEALSVVVTLLLLAIPVIVLARLGLPELGVEDELVPIGIAVVVGAPLGVGLELLLINPGKLVGLIAASGAVVVAVWSVAEMFWRRDVVREGEYFGRAAGVFRWTVRGEHSVPEAKRVALLRHSRWRSVVAALLLAAVLAWGAVESRKSHRFWAARVTMTNGTCVSGTLLVRDSDEVLLAGRADRTARGQAENRLIEIPSLVISSIQVIGPSGPARPISAETCAKAASAVHPGPFAPYPLVGDSSAPEVDPPVIAVPGPEGREGKEGKRGPAGERGPEGKRGAEGERGTTGKTGKAGPPGETGPTGKTGPRGETGPQGNTGPTGKSGATGRAGARGERGAQGSRGERGLKGERGQRGPRGFSSVGGS